MIVLPSNVYEQAIPRCQYKWNGDVWKAIVEFRTYKNFRYIHLLCRSWNWSYIC